MGLYAPGSLIGKYTPSSPADLAHGDYVIANEFAYRRDGDGEGIVNEKLAEYVIDHYHDRRIMLQIV